MTTRKELGALVDTDIRDNTTMEITPAIDRVVRNSIIDAVPTWGEMAGGWHAWYAVGAFGAGKIEFLDSDANAVSDAGNWNRVASLKISVDAYPTPALVAGERGDLTNAVATIGAGQVAIVWEADTAIGAFTLGAATPAYVGNPQVLDSVTVAATPLARGTVGSMGALTGARQLTILSARLAELLNANAVAFDIHDDIATEETTPQDDDRVAVSAEDEAGDPMRWLSLSRLANYVKGKIGNATTAVAGLMSAADKTKLDAVALEVVVDLGDYTRIAQQTPDPAAGEYEIVSGEIGVTPVAGKESEFAKRWHVGLEINIGNDATIRLKQQGQLHPRTLHGTVYVSNFDVVSGTVPAVGQSDEFLAPGDLTHDSELATVAKTGDYDDLHNKIAAGLGLELDGNHLELSHEVLTAVFPVKGVWTYKANLTEANAYEINNSNDNDTLPSGVDSANVDFVQLDKETFAAFLDDYPLDWPIYIENDDGSEQLLFWPAYKRDDPLDSSVIQFWYDPTKAVIKGLGQYRQFTTNASLKVGFADMGVPPYLRDALPTGATPALTRTTKFLLRDWGETTLDHLNEHIVPKTTGPTVLTATWEDQLGSITAGSGKIGWGNALVNGVGTLWWGIESSVPVSGGGTVPRADVVAYFNSHHEVDIAVGSVVIKGPIQNVSLLAGVYYITIGESVGTPHRVAATQTGGTPADGAATTIDLDSLLATKDYVQSEIAAILPQTLQSFTAANIALSSSEVTVATLSITPANTGRKVYAQFNATISGDRNTGGVENAYATVRVKRGGTTIRTEAYDFFTHVQSQTQYHQSVVLIVDEPASAAAVTYTVTVQLGTSLENGGCRNRSLILQEV